jgi:hypothetical protein
VLQLPILTNALLSQASTESSSHAHTKLSQEAIHCPPSYSLHPEPHNHRRFVISCTLVI